WSEGKVKGVTFQTQCGNTGFKDKICLCEVCQAKLSILTEYDKSIKEMIEKVLSILKEGCGVNFVLEEQDCICGDDFEYEDKVKVLLCELCLDKIKRIELLSKLGDNSEVKK
ncbi:MAG: hypothetical protein WC346_12490, partial [Methanogenium sp.]